MENHVEAYVTLRVDAMYIVLARRCRQKAAECIPDMEELTNRLSEAEERQRQVETTGAQAPEAMYDALRPILDELSSLDWAIGAAYRPFLENVALVHVLCAACLEAHINRTAREKVSRKLYEEFDRWSLKAKWLFLPRILHLDGFGMNKEPFQSFSDLIRFRNALLHYRSKRERWSGSPVPRFLTELGLTLKHVDRSLSAVRGMVGRLAEQMMDAPPSWISDGTELTYFALERRRSQA
ncbi:MAG: hypothetical protein KAY32_14885 [Candidatus Eisenbacteria sp.]|nr:hypothetical protein [Candidatus Eisenbacteria bacterium]